MIGFNKLPKFVTLVNLGEFLIIIVKHLLATKKYNKLDIS